MENKTKILLVEDEALIALDEKRELEACGYEVFHVMDGNAAIQAVSDGKALPDIVLMDIDLGAGTDGTEAAERIIEKSGLPVLFLSSHTEREIVEKTSGISSYGYVVKNSSITVLDAAVRMALRLFAANRSLREEEEKLASIIRNSNDLIILSDNEGRVTYISPQCERVTGHPPERFMGVKFPDIIHPDDRARCGDVWQNVVGKGMQIRDFQYRIIDSQGTTRWVSHSASPITALGRTSGIQNSISDITAIKASEEAIRENRDLLAETQSIAHVGGWTWDVERQFMSWSDETYRIHGFCPESFPAGSAEHIRRSIDCYDPEDRPVISAAFQSCIESGKVYELEFPLTRVDGRRIRIRTKGQPVFLNGKVVRVSGTITDITEIARSRDIELEAHRIAENIPLGLHLYHLESLSDDRTLRMVYANPAVKALTGIPPEAIIGKTLDESFPGLRAQGIPQRYADVVRTQTAKTFEDIVYGDDRVPLATFFVRAFPLPGNRVGIMFDNITERKRTEDDLRRSREMLSETARVARVGGWEIDQQGHTLAWTAETFRIHELAQERPPDVSEAIGFYHPDDQALVRNAVERAVKAGEPFDFEARLLTAKGNLRWVRAIGRIVSGRVQGIIQDISDRKEHENAFRTQLREKEILLKEVHHRIKNNIAAMASFLRMSASRAGPEARAAIQEASGRIESMGRLYRQLLQAEGYRSLPVKKYLEDLVQTIVSLALPNDNVAVALSVDEERYAVRMLFPLGLIVNELVTNALKYAFPGNAGGRVDIVLARKDGTHTLTVRDNGVGLPEGFDTDKTGGFGIMLVRMMAEQIAGRFSLHSENGTCCTVEFQDGNAP